MATVTGYMIVRGDFSTFDPVSLLASSDATPGNEISDVYTSPESPPPTEDYPFKVGTDLVAACNVMWQFHKSGKSLVDKGLRLVEVTFDNPADVSTPDNVNDRVPSAVGTPFPIPGTGHWIKRADVVAEIDAATIQATATIP